MMLVCRGSLWTLHGNAHEMQFAKINYRAADDNNHGCFPLRGVEGICRTVLGDQTWRQEGYGVQEQRVHAGGNERNYRQQGINRMQDGEQEQRGTKWRSFKTGILQCKAEAEGTAMQAAHDQENFDFGMTSELSEIQNRHTHTTR
jgi:hypothetical protein